MQELNLLNVKIERIKFSNNIVIPNAAGPVDIQIDTNISSTVNYDLANKQCKCTTTVTLSPKDIPIDFGAEICVTGLFSCGEIEDRKIAHIEACKSLFPHVQSSVISFMTMVGFPNFIVSEPPLDIADFQLND